MSAAGAEPVTGPPQTGALSAVEAEVMRHHRVIERWLGGRAGPEEFGRFAAAHARSFTLAGPDGRVLPYQAVLAEMRAAYGTAPDLTITIEGVRVVAAAGPLTVVTYREWQRGRGRLSTAVLRLNGPTPSWLHLHESWLPDTGTPSGSPAGTPTSAGMEPGAGADSGAGARPAPG